MTFSRESDFVLNLRLVSISGAIFLVMALLFSGCGIGDSESDSEDVVFSADAGGNIDVYKIDSGSGESVRLTASEGDDLAPMWSPNKKLIAFISDRNGAGALWLMDSDGESKRQVSEPSNDVSAFRWSPDSDRIAVELNGADRSISILDIDTKEMTPLTSASENVRVGDWSPDGEWVVYSVVEGPESAIRRRNPTGVDEITLFDGSGLGPRWSHNGQWVAFSRPVEDGSVELVVMDKDGGNVVVAAEGVHAESHGWAPDSKKLVYARGEFSEAEIYVVGWDGKGVEKLTSNRVADGTPRWSPEGSAILFLSEGGGSYDIFSMDTDGGHQVRLTSGDELVLDADW